MPASFLGHLVVFAAVATVAVAVLAGRGPRAPGSRMAADLSLAPFRGVSARHVDEATRAVAAFRRDYLDTFRAPGPDAATRVRRLFAHRARAMRLLNEVRLRLPNDLDAEQRLAATIEGVDRSMLERIEDARDRGGAPLVHPGPVDAAWYGAWYRAANDTVG